MADMIGRVIDHFRLDAMLGDGGMGTVYRAYDLSLERPVALKLMHPHYARREEFRARLRQEAKTQASLDHPSIVRVLAYGEDDGEAYIVMEYIAGGSLRAHLQRLQERNQFLPLEQSLQIGFQIADALHYAHQRGLIHRDVKPSNIILKRLDHPDESGEQPFRAVLTDFGLVKLLQGDALTQSGTTLGTPAYMSPEQCAGEELDGRTDLYSLGVVLYELLTNRLPFTFNSLAEAIAAHLRGVMPPSTREYRPEIPAVVDAVVMRALAKDPADRFVNAEAMETALRSALYALADRPTRVLATTDVDYGFDERVEGAPEEYRLVIQTPGYEPTYVALSQAALTLGRDADNDIVLPADGVSRHHATLRRSGDGWVIVDLGGINGTLLNGQRLRVNVETPFRPGDRLRVGPYELLLQAPAGVQPESRTPIAEAPTPAPQAVATSGGAPLALFLARDRVPAAPGEVATFHLEIANRSQSDDRVTVVVEGLPERWVTAPADFITVPAGSRVPLTIDISVPRQAALPAGRQRFRVLLRSQQFSDETPAITASLMLGALESFEASLVPQRVSLPDTVQVRILNTGNAPNSFEVIGRDPNQRIRFQGERGQIRLEPGQAATVELALEAGSANWFSKADPQPYAVEVTSRAGARQMVSGEALIEPLVPPWLSYTALTLVVFICVFSFLFLVFGDAIRRPRGASATAAAATTTAVAQADLQTIIAATATIDAATRLAITPTSTGDADRDGLSDRQEALLGTSPEIADTDGDGLLDGAEALELGCNPLVRDTDGDFLNDWDEVNVYRTLCNNPDTDGDGLSDGLEVTQGTDPLSGATATPAATSTAPPQPTTTPLPGTATATATVTATPTATATGTQSATPSPTAVTVTPSPTASFTPSATPTTTPSPTITLTPTPTPEPVVACVQTPPVADGELDDTAWALGPMMTLPGTENAASVFLVKETGGLYYGFLVTDPAPTPNDGLRLYLDINGNLGDPDGQDRLIEISRSGTYLVFRGIGNNNDGAAWEPLATEQIVVGVGEVAGDGWSVEVALLQEPPVIAVADPYGMMLEVIDGGATLLWPEDAEADDAATWAPVENPPCPPSP